MSIFRMVPVRIDDELVKRELLKCKPHFFRTVHTNRKSKDCLRALALIEKNEPLDQLLAVRLLGQINGAKICNRFFNLINEQLKVHGLRVYDMGSALTVGPDNDELFEMFNKEGGTK